MKKSVMIILFLGLIRVAGSAQHTEKGIEQSRLTSVKATIHIGNSVISDHQFSKELVSMGLPGFENDMFTIGFGGGVFFKRLYLGGEGMILLGDSYYHEEIIAGLSSGYSTLDAGILILNHPMMKLYPVLGIGVGGLKYSGTNLYQSVSAISNLRLNLDIFPGGGPVSGGAVFSINFGYQVDPLEKRWYNPEDYSVADPIAAGIPEPLKLSGFRFMIGLGWGLR